MLTEPHSGYVEEGKKAKGGDDIMSGKYKHTLAVDLALEKMEHHKDVVIGRNDKARADAAERVLWGAVLGSAAVWCGFGVMIGFIIWGRG